MDYSNYPNYNLPTSQTIQPQFNPAAILIFFAVYAVVIIVLILAGWKIFRKANKPGWAIIIPIYNTIVLLEIIKRPIWWILLLFIPIVNIIISFIVAMDLAKAFGRSIAFGVILLFFFSPIGLLILGFGKSTYKYSTLNASQTQTPTNPIPPTPQATTG